MSDRTLNILLTLVFGVAVLFCFDASRPLGITLVIGILIAIPVAFFLIVVWKLFDLGREHARARSARRTPPI